MAGLPRVIRFVLSIIIRRVCMLGGSLRLIYRNDNVWSTLNHNQISLEETAHLAELVTLRPTGFSPFRSIISYVVYLIFFVFIDVFFAFLVRTVCMFVN
jgi:hypothetical protein